MSRFDAQRAHSLAEHAIRLPVDASDAYKRRQEETAPLRGKEAALMGALQEAERAHDETLAAIRDERARLQAVRAARPECKKLADHLAKALEVWSALDNEGRKGIAWFAHSSGEGGSWDGTDSYLDDIAVQFGNQLRAMQDAAQSVGEDVKFSAGRIAGVSQGKGLLQKDRPELGPLIAFAFVLRDFWRAETGDSRFGYDDGTRDHSDGKRVPVSAPARLLWEASQYLDPDYTLANIESVFTALNQAPANK